MAKNKKTKTVRCEKSFNQYVSGDVFGVTPAYLELLKSDGRGLVTELSAEEVAAYQRARYGLPDEDAKASPAPPSKPERTRPGAGAGRTRG